MILSRRFCITTIAACGLIGSLLAAPPQAKATGCGVRAAVYAQPVYAVQQVQAVYAAPVVAAVVNPYVPVVQYQVQPVVAVQSYAVQAVAVQKSYAVQAQVKVRAPIVGTSRQVVRQRSVFRGR